MEAHACADTSIDHVLDAREGVGSLLAGPTRFLENLGEVFGSRFLRYLGLTYFGLKGIAFGLLSSGMLPYFQQMQVTGNGFQLASVVARLPWSMKGFTGMLSDCFPLGRYHKRGYLMLASLVGCVGFTALAILPLSSMGPPEVWPVASLFCCANVLVATFDLLCEGKYSEIMREERAGSEVLTLVWACVMLGSLVGALIVGIFVDIAGPRPLLAACIPLAAIAFWRTAAGDLPEEPARSRAALRLKVLSEPRLFVLAAAMAVGGLIIALSVALLDSPHRTLLAIVVSFVLVVASFKAMPRTLARCNLYMFLLSVTYMDITGPLAYFYTGTTDCVLDAPHFSYSYYLSVSNVVGALGGTAGTVLFRYMQDWQFRTAFRVTALIQVLASAFDLLIVFRWNLALGVPDQWAYLFGDAACQSMAIMMANMPMAMLTARLCPRGAEATVFAIFAGFQNFGASVGSILGVQLTEALGVEASATGPCDFGRLGTLIFLAHGVAPLLCLPLSWCLVPAARIDDNYAFEAESPPPSFRSPPASPSASPHGAQDPGTPGDEYLLMEDAGSGTLPKQFS